MSTSLWSMVLETEQGALADLEKPKGAAAGEEGRKHARDACVEQLEARLDWTMMVCEAIWSLAREPLGLTDERLKDRITELDLADGKLDGRKRRAPATCGACRRTVSQRFPRCVYCGSAIERDPFA